MFKRLIWCACTLLSMVTTAATLPRLVVVDDKFNFGFSPQHAYVSHRFWLKSVGEDSVKIVEVIPGCGCTKAPLERSVLSPGDSTRIEINLSTGSLTGDVNKSPRIKTNEADPTKFIRITTHVITKPDSTYPVVIKPHKIDMTGAGQQKVKEARFTIVNMSDTPLTPRLISTFEDIFDVVLPGAIPPGRSAEGRIVLKPMKQAPELDKSFTLEFDDVDKSRFTVPIKLIERTAQTTAAGSGH